MKIVFLADIHGNLPAALVMEKLLDRVKPDLVWFLGDAVGKGPSNAETCDWVRTHCDRFVGGNWDYGIGGKEFSEDQYFWDQLGPDRMEWLRTLPPEGEITLSGVRFRLFHGRPVTDLITDRTEDDVLYSAFHSAENGDFGGVIFADSHRPFFRTLRCGYLMNTGSVGNSLGQPRVHALMVEGGDTAEDPLLFTVLSAPYDNEESARIALADGQLPHMDAYLREIRTGIYSRA